MFKNQTNTMKFLTVLFGISIVFPIIANANLNFPLSPDGEFEAELIGSGTDLHYQIKEVTSGKIRFTTRAEFETPNDVKAGMFYDDSTHFVAVYHYGHNGGYSWIGTWDLSRGVLVRSEKKFLSETQQQWVRDLTPFLRRQAPVPSRPNIGVGRSIPSDEEPTPVPTETPQTPTPAEQFIEIISSFQGSRLCNGGTEMHVLNNSTDRIIRVIVREHIEYSTNPVPVSRDKNFSLNPGQKARLGCAGTISSGAIPTNFRRFEVVSATYAN